MFLTTTTHNRLLISLCKLLSLFNEHAHSIVIPSCMALAWSHVHSTCGAREESFCDLSFAAAIISEVQCVACAFLCGAGQSCELLDLSVVPRPDPHLSGSLVKILTFSQNAHDCSSVALHHVFGCHDASALLCATIG